MLPGTTEIVASDPSTFPPMRDALPTLPYDLSEYARLHTGPESWSAYDADLDEELAMDEDAFVSGPLIGFAPTDVPRVAVSRAECVERGLGHREGFILSLLDDCSSVEALIDVAGLPEGETIAILCDLCASGIVTLEPASPLPAHVADHAA